MAALIGVSRLESQHAKKLENSGRIVYGQGGNDGGEERVVTSVRSGSYRDCRRRRGLGRIRGCR